MRRAAASFRALLLHRPNRPLVLLLVSLGLAGAATFDAMRAVRSNRAMARELLSDYGQFAAWSYSQALTAGLDSLAWLTLGPVMHEHLHNTPGIPHPSELVHSRRYDARSGTHAPWAYPPSFFFGYRVGSDSLETARNALGDPHLGWRVDSLSAVPAADRALARDTVLAHLRTRWRPGWRYAVFTAGGGEGRRLVAYTLMPTTWGDTILYGMVMERADLLRAMRDVFARQALLPAAITRGVPKDSMLSLAVDDGRAPVRVSAGAADWTLPAEEVLPASLGSLRVRAAVRPELAPLLAVGGLPRSRVPLLLGVLAVAAVLSVVAAGQIRREGELARLRADFVASVSHELRTPLAQVRLFVETLLLGRAASEERRRWALENVDRETMRLANLVENVLLFSRSGRAATALALSPADLGEEVARAVRAFEPLAAVRRASLKLEMEPGVAAKVHAESFRQVLVNLLDNAVKYGPPGQTVTVSLAAEGGSARLAVTDQGPGVPAAEREAVWRPFFRGGATAVRAVGGSGIGLSVVRDLVARHGGEAWVEDAPGGGARFVVRLPREGVAGSAAPDEAPVAALAAKG